MQMSIMGLKLRNFKPPMSVDRRKNNACVIAHAGGSRRLLLMTGNFWEWSSGRQQFWDHEAQK